MDTSKSFQPDQKEITYLGKDFGQLKDSLMRFAQTYYPATYKDFSNASTGMMFIEMAAYVGDVLSYYTDYQFRESLITSAVERKNIIALAKTLGYKAKTTVGSVGTLDVYQLVPAISNGDGTFSPDLRYTQIIKTGMVVASDAGVNFVTTEPVDFSVDTQNSPIETSVFQRNSSGQPEFYVLKKNVGISAGQVNTKSVQISSGTPFFKIPLPETNVIGVLDVMDADGNRWYETDYLSQDLVEVDVENIYKNDSQFYQYRDSVPFLMKFLKTSRRFVTGITADDTTFLEFGSGTDVQGDMMVIPSPNAIGKPTPFGSKTQAYDPSNFLNSKSYGQMPANTALVIRYLTGGGVESNVNANSIKNIVGIEYFGDLTELSRGDQNTIQIIRQSIKVNNPVPTTGGKGSETNSEIKANALSNFPAQNRTVTKGDYVVRTYAMPAKYGNIAKAFVATDAELSTSSTNPYAINLYVLCYDGNSRLTHATPALITNLRSHLNQFRLLTDGVNILDGYIINVGVDFSVITYKNYNKRDVLTGCLAVVQDYFDIDNMQFSQPINLSRLELEIAKVDGVQSIASLSLKNLTSRDGDYSPHEYDIVQATVSKIVYPSIDPSVFEVKFPSKDIIGRCV